MLQDVEQVLIDRHVIARRVRQLAVQIAADLLDGDDNRAVTIIPILTGSFIFVADLIREMPLPMQIRLLSISSYPGTATQSKGARVHEQFIHLPATLRDRHVLLVDDILDSGQTLQLATSIIGDLEPASLRTCVLLRKRRAQPPVMEADYACFDIPDEFVVGYGLDYDDYYRNLPDIVALKPKVLATAQSSDTRP